MNEISNFYGWPVFADSKIYLLYPYQINSCFGNKLTKLAKNLRLTHHFQYIILYIQLHHLNKIQKHGSSRSLDIMNHVITNDIQNCEF